MEQVAKSKGTWGRRQERKPEEIRKLIDDFFSKLVIPTGWKCLGKSIISDTNGLLSEGFVFNDLQTSGINTMHYKIVFIVAPERGAICEKQLVDFGKAKYICVISNKTIEGINEFIQKKYTDKEEEE